MILSNFAFECNLQRGCLRDVPLVPLVDGIRYVRIEPSPVHTKSGRTTPAPSSYSAALTTTSRLQ